MKRSAAVKQNLPPRRRLNAAAVQGGLNSLPMLLTRRHANLQTYSVSARLEKSCNASGRG